MWSSPNAEGGPNRAERVSYVAEHEGGRRGTWRELETWIPQDLTEHEFCALGKGPSVFLY